MHEGVTAVYKSNVDLFFCVLGAQNENEVRELVIYNRMLIIILTLGYSFPSAADAGWCS